MKSGIAILMVVASVALAAAPDDKKSTPKTKASQQTMTGCVDEQDGNYVLVDDRMLNKLADLEAVGASNEALFAKHMGHKVTVKGSKSSQAEGKFRVSSIEDISSVCAPAQSNPQ